MIMKQTFDSAAEAAHGASRIGIPDILIADLLHDGGSFLPLPDPFAQEIYCLDTHK